MDTELQRLICVHNSVLGELAANGIVMRALE
jgi:hypothetical protein